MLNMITLTFAAVVGMNSDDCPPGSLDLPVAYEVESYPDFIDAHDIDDDGDLDILVGGYGNTAYRSSFSIFLNDGTGSFSESMHTSSVPSFGALQFTDLNNDGCIDIGFTTRADDGSVKNHFAGFFPGDCGGNFGVAEVIVDLPRKAETSNFGDIDGDGDTDFIAIYADDSPAPIFLSEVYDQTNNNFEPMGSSSFNTDTADFVTPFTVQLADIDNDGDLDTVIGTTNFSTKINIGINTTGVSHIYNPQFSFILNDRINTINLADMDGDSDLDITVDTERSVGIFKNVLGLGIFEPASFYNINFSTGRSYSLSLSDLDSDGSLDAIVSSESKMKIMRNNGSGILLPPNSFPIATAQTSLALCSVARDFDNDGDDDIAVYVQNRDTNPWTHSMTYLKQECPSFCAADFDSNGQFDFFDVSQFVISFQNQDPSADMNGDDLYNFFDVSAFIELFSSQCSDS